MINTFFEHAPFSLTREEKRKLLSARSRELTRHHYNNCTEYERILDAIGFELNSETTYEDIPFLPVSLFKKTDLKSIAENNVFKVMTSSGTTGQAVSKIYLDRETSALQQKVLAKIFSDFAGSARLPMIIIDCPSVIKNRAMFSARGAGILGFSMFGSQKIYALNDDMSLNVDLVKAFIESHKNKPIFLFGFTFMIWQHFCQELKKYPAKYFDLSNGILIHGGGWKKLESENISTEMFKETLFERCGIERVHNYYGMVEQTGSIYMECECGHLHASIFSDILVRRPKDFSICKNGEKGIIQVVSAIPQSYPGHSVLTEDEGAILGEDDCPCGRKGKYFSIYGRLKNAEIRGCSDTYAVGF